MCKVTNFVKFLCPLQWKSVYSQCQFFRNYPAISTFFPQLFHKGLKNQFPPLNVHYFQKCLPDKMCSWTPSLPSFAVLAATPGKQMRKQLQCPRKFISVTHVMSKKLEQKSVRCLSLNVAHRNETDNFFGKRELFLRPSVKTPGYRIQFGGPKVHFGKLPSGHLSSSQKPPAHFLKPHPSQKDFVSLKKATNKSQK